MNRKQFNDLRVGDVVCGSDGKSLVITGVYSDRKTAVRTVDLTNPGEWKLVRKANYNAEQAANERPEDDDFEGVNA